MTTTRNTVATERAKETRRNALMALPSLSEGEAGSGGFDNTSSRVSLVGGGPFSKDTMFGSYDGFMSEF